VCSARAAFQTALAASAFIMAMPSPTSSFDPDENGCDTAHVRLDFELDY
jgi:hypothetical protein